ncbi:MAG: hypothetical protein U5J82_06530 [Desulfobacterales bacterium]|nr:hypothetical protein [Desulfobacterales bacterium]
MNPSIMWMMLVLIFQSRITAGHWTGREAWKNLYCRYFDQQYDMIRCLKPAVVGHMDLIRIFDDGYRARLEMDFVRKRISRNRIAIRDLGIVLDFNLRALYRST